MSLLPFAMLGVRQVNASPNGLRQHTPILIDGPGNFTARNGVTGGSGTQNNPYIIQGWSIDASTTNGIEIRNMITAGEPIEPLVFFVIRNVFIHSEGGTQADILVDSFASPPGCFECPGNIFNGVIANSILTGNRDGVRLQDSDNIIVSGVTVHDSQTGVNCVNSDFLQIRANRITDSGTGISVSCAVIDVFCNTILNADNGMVVGNYGSIDIEHNYIASPRGFTLQGSGDTIVANNQIIGSSGPTVHLYQYGISEYQADSFSIENNTIINTTPTNFQSGPAGVNITSSGDFSINGNTVKAGNSYGIVLHSSFESFNFADPFLNHNFLYHNNILNNTVQAFDDSPSQNLWDNGYPSGGNFWSDFTGVDNCGGPQQKICPSPDGIGDTPYVFNHNTDQYPLIRPLQ